MRYISGLVLLLAATVLCVHESARADGRVKVFILAGQSNMEGKGSVENGYGGVAGAIGSLRYEVDNDPANYGQLVDTNGDWVVRDDVWIWSTTDGGEKGNLTVGYGSNAAIGPEYGFGQVVGNLYDDQVLLIKTAWGGKSLAVDFRPPSSGGTVGPYYTKMINDVNSVLENLASEFPDYAGQGIEIVGFGWHQGWNDRINQTYVDEYEQNLENLINDVREDLDAPDLPFVVANTGMGGWDATGRAVELMEAQLAVADSVEYPEFEGNVAGVETRGFWRTSDVSPSTQDYHWNSNGETYYLIGDSMGDAIAGLDSNPAIFYPQGDLNLDEVLDELDWTVFLAGNHTDLSGLTEDQAYLMGDLDGDGDNDIDDFGLFRDAYNRVNGAGAFGAMIATVPEPGSILLLSLGFAGWVARRRKRS